MGVTRTSPSATNILYLLIGALVVIAGALAYYAYDQSRRGGDMEIRLEMPKSPAN